MSAPFRNETSGPPPPPAPPLPPPRYGQRAATAIARLAQPFLYGSRPPSAQGTRGDDIKSPVISPSVPRSSSPLSSRTLVHESGFPIAAIDISPLRTHAILAGRDILKTIRIEEATCFEDFNLRSTIIAYASAYHTSRDAVSAQHKDHLAANDVKWSHGKFDTTIATAAANGRIVLYDLNLAGVESARLHEHVRQVHRIAFNPHQGALLLSGSQDATIRLWDIRQLAGNQSVMTCGSVNKFSGNSEGIRDLRWSPTDGVEFATGTDNGVIQRWDIRKSNAPLLKINAHDKTCHSIDWHPAGRYLASGGADKNVKIWDFRSSERRMKPSWQLRAPQAVLNARWRPSSNSAVDENSTTWQGTQIATTYDLNDPRIHIWDLRRPHVPFQELDRYDTPASDILWHSEDRLWSVGATGLFTQTDMNLAPRPLEGQNVNIVTTAPNGQICFFSEPRIRRRSLLEETSANLLQRSHTEGSSGDNFSGSHSTMEGSFEEPSMLSLSLKQRRLKSASTRSRLGSTPFSANAVVHPNKLDDAMKPSKQYQTRQVAAYGYVLGVFDVDAFQYLARYYETPLSASEIQEASDLHIRLRYLFEANALLAAQTSQYRLAQSWRVLGEAVKTELRTRAEEAMDRRIHCSSSNNPPITPISVVENRNKQSSPKIVDIENLQDVSSGLPNIESSSQMPTPLIRPTKGLLGVPACLETSLNSKDSSSSQLLNINMAKQSMMTHVESNADQRRGSFSGLSALINSASRKEPLNFEEYGSEITPSHVESFIDIDRQIEDRRIAMNNYRAKSRPLLTLDEPLESRGRHYLTPRLDRHDSNESFQMFSTSSDGSHRTMSTGGSFGESQKSDSSDPIPERWNQSLAEEIFVYHTEETHLDTTSLPNKTQYLGHAVQPRKAFLSDRSPEYPTSATMLPPIRRPSNPKPPIIHLSSHLKGDIKADTPTTKHSSSCNHIIPVDFDPPKFPMSNPKPWSATTVIPAILHFHLSALSDVQLPTFLTLYLQPLFPALFDYNHSLSILLGYHEHLISLCLFVQAAELRKACYPTYQDVYERSTYNSQTPGFFCMTCNKPVKGGRPGYCERCKKYWGFCPVCESDGESLHPASQPTMDAFGYEINFPNGADALWRWCRECGHGGHSGCLRAWWEDEEMSEGACPLQGCICDCVPGSRRDERIKQIDAEKKKQKLAGEGGVVSDGWVVAQSRAVDLARGVLGGGSNGGGLGGGGNGIARGLSGSRSGALSGGLAGSKKVRLVVPDQVEVKEGVRTEKTANKENGTSRSVP